MMMLSLRLERLVFGRLKFDGLLEFLFLFELESLFGICFFRVLIDLELFLFFWGVL